MNSVKSVISEEIFNNTLKKKKVQFHVQNLGILPMKNRRK